MTTAAESSTVDVIRRYAHPLTGDAHDFDPLLRRVGDAHIVLIGEASHGTHEFYRVRAEITKRLIREKGFSAVAVEADWPDAYRVNRFIRGRGPDAEASDALGAFMRFPQWMWRNADVLDFVGWLRAFNDAVTLPRLKVGFYGLDVYSLQASMAAVIDYLWRVDPDAARLAEARYSCFDPFGEDPVRYGLATVAGQRLSCEAEVVAQLIDLRQSAVAYARADGRFEPDTTFYIEQNARVVRNAERYYRAMVHGGAEAWNLRDRHMSSTLEALRHHLREGRHEPKIVVWAHNSHLGDARWTEMSARGETNVGELVRVQHPHDVVSVGFTTYTGTVTAAHDWGKPALRIAVVPGLAGSYEQLFHSAVGDDGEVGSRNVMLSFDSDHATRDELRHALDGPLLERA
ncbi:MAG TPA: erythromycin esterase family protein, partial [Gemmatimonadaceae bacterium]|nr:erythromycin esterase family protein [Gemmatimonadaceae bacterium]